MKKIVLLSLILIALLVIAGCDVKQLDQMDQNNREKQVVEEKVLSAEEKEQKRNKLVKRLESEGYTNWYEGKEPTLVYYKDEGDKRTVVHSGLFFEVTIPADKKYRLMRLPQDPTESRIYIYKGNITDHMRILDGMMIDIYSDELIRLAAKDLKEKLAKDKLNIIEINNQNYLKESGEVYIYPGEYLKDDSRFVLVRTILGNVMYQFNCATGGENYEDNFLKCENVIQSIKFL